MDKYDIYQNGKSVGWAKISPEGLYYLVECKCILPDKQFYTVEMDVNEKRISLGTYIPLENNCGIVKRIPAKLIKDCNLRFYLCSKNNIDKYRVTIGEPVSFLVELENLRLTSIEYPSVGVFSKGI